MQARPLWETAPNMTDVSEGNATLRMKHSGPAVREMQDILQQGGFLPKFGVDGKFGAETETALKKWQASLGLEETGKLDAKTWKALRAHQLSQPDVPKGPLASRAPEGEDPSTVTVRDVNKPPSIADVRMHDEKVIRELANKLEPPNWTEAHELVIA